MPNSLVTKPVVIVADITTFRNAAAVTAINCTQGCGLRVKKLMLCVGGSAATAGTVTITAPSDGAVLYPPIPVTATTAANTIIINDTFDDVAGTLTWRDFAVTGVTATGTVLYLWYEV
jgi:hypothetical protein